MKDFAAIDFETANGKRTSVCSVGVVVVRGGEVTDSFYSLIRPRPNFYSRFTTAIHGLTYDDTAEAPDFETVWKQIAPRIEGLPLVAHNSPFDEGCPARRLRTLRHALSRLSVLLYLPGFAADVRHAAAQSSAAYRFGRLRFRLGEPSPRSGRCRSLRPDRAQNPVKAYGSIEMHPKVISFWGAFHLKGSISYQSPSSSWNRISQRL